MKHPNDFLIQRKKGLLVEERANLQEEEQKAYSKGRLGLICGTNQANVNRRLAKKLPFGFEERCHAGSKWAKEPKQKWLIWKETVAWCSDSWQKEGGKTLIRSIVEAIMARSIYSQLAISLGLLSHALAISHAFLPPGQQEHFFRFEKKMEH